MNRDSPTSSFTEVVGWYLLFAIVAIAPWIMGGRNALGKFVYIALVMAYVSCFLLGQCATRSGQYWRTGVEWLLVAVVALVLFTCLPLGSELVAKLAPETFELLPAWSPPDEGARTLGAWQTLSLSPRATRLGLCLLLAHIGLFVTVTQRLGAIADIEKALKIVASATVLMAIVGLLQYLSGTDRYAFLFMHPSRVASDRLSGPFANANHFTHFLALGIGALIWWWQSVVPRQERGPTGNRFTSGNDQQDRASHLFAALGIAIVVIAGLLASSRGGTLVLICAFGFCSLVLLRAGVVRWPMVAAALGVSGLVGVGLLIHGTEQVEKELSSLATVSVEELDHGKSRRNLWAANIKAAQMFPWFGTGVGSHAEVYPRFFPYPSAVEYTHAESGYVHIMSENGGVGIALLTVGVLVLGVWAVRAVLGARCAAAGTCGMAAASGVLVTLLHSVWDFPWYLTGTMAPAVVLAACVCRLARDHARADGPREPVGLSRFNWISTSAAFASCAVAVCIHYVPSAAASTSWENYKRLSLSEEVARDAADKHRTLAAEDERARYAHLQQMSRWLERTLKADPNHYRAHLRMAAVLMKAFEMQQRYQPNAMAIDQIREAAMASEFESDAEYAAWLNRAIGENVAVLVQARAHLMAGMRGLPLAGRAYVRLVDLAFLPPALEVSKDVLAHQSQSARPFDGEVLFRMGRNAALQGDSLGALEFWKRAFHQDEGYRAAIIKSIAPRMPSPAFVEYFQPNRFQLNELFRFYQDMGYTEQAKQVAPQLAAMLSEAAKNSLGTRAARLWLHVAGVYRYAGDFDRSIAAATSAVKSTPNHFDARLALAKHLMAGGQFERAAAEYTWCLKRRRGHKVAARGLQSAEHLLRTRSASSHTVVPPQTARQPSSTRAT